ncbi:hypothetical protein NLJ89_g8882 [Agrocybe chaxingu]|uniref:C2H2-type domain-containing protein n=1 Tax=Agrocybe chaxingu TaxID=84603 RepID=A0A9W8JWS1_9AGAR|nr:hypothetical protein NLJ89_g8882 [Agrocybe chaxingu]
MTTMRTVRNPHSPPQYPHATNFVGATGSNPFTDASPAHSNSLMKFSSFCTPSGDGHFVQPQPSMPTDVVHFNTDIFAQPAPSPVYGPGEDLQSRVIAARERGDMKSVDYLHKFARTTGKYPKLGMFCTPGGYDIDPLDVRRSAYSQPVSPPVVYPVEQMTNLYFPFHNDEAPLSPPATGSDAQTADTAIPKKKLMFTESEQLAITKPPKRRSLVNYFDSDNDDEQEDTPSTPGGSEYRDSSPEFMPSITIKLPKLHQMHTPASPNKKRRFVQANEATPASHSASANTQTNTQLDAPSLASARQDSEQPSTANNGKPFYEIRDKSGKIIYQCRDCAGFRTRALGDMGRHLESKAHKPPSHCCQLCPSVFTRKDALVRHEKRKHKLGGW